MTLSSLETFILTAKRGKKKGKGGDAAKRSRFLGIVMKEMAGESGKQMADAVEAKDLEKFRGLWEKATSDIMSTLEIKFKSGSDSAKENK